MHFDTLTPEYRSFINSPTYKAPAGESWEEVNARAKDFFRDKLTEEGVYMCISHGGLICAMTYYIGMQDAISNCSLVGLKIEQNEPVKIEFAWDLNK